MVRQSIILATPFLMLSASPYALAAVTSGTVEIQCSENFRNGRPSYSFARPLEFKNGSAGFSRGGQTATGEPRNEQWTIDARKLGALSIRAVGASKTSRYTVSLKGRTTADAKSAALSGSTLNKKGMQIRRCSAHVELGGQKFAALSAAQPVIVAPQPIVVQPVNNINITIVLQLAAVANAEAAKAKAEAAKADAEAKRAVALVELERAQNATQGGADAARAKARAEAEAKKSRIEAEIAKASEALEAARVRVDEEKRKAAVLQAAAPKRMEAEQQVTPKEEAQADANTSAQPMRIASASPAALPGTTANSTPPVRVEPAPRSDQQEAVRLRAEAQASKDAAERAQKARAEAEMSRARAEADMKAAREEARVATARAETEIARAKAEADSIRRQAEADSVRRQAEAEAIRRQAEADRRNAATPLVIAQAPAAPVPAQRPSPQPVTDQNARAFSNQIGALNAQINVLATVLNEQKSIEQSAAGSGRDAVRATILAIEARMQIVKQDVSQRERVFKTYLTSIRPDDRDLYLTARKASEIYPRIPYYIPGTSETGEFWVEPIVSDRGEMMFHFQFVDIDAYVTNVRGKIEMKLAELEDTQKALFKLHEWSSLAHREKLRRNYEKRITCFPAQDCPDDGDRKDGASSTEIRFNVYEDGSTAGRIQRNKGRFVEGYNVSIDSGLLLQAYLAHVIKEARLEFKSGTQDKNSLDKLFQ